MMDKLVKYPFITLAVMLMGAMLSACAQDVKPLWLVNFEDQTVGAAPARWGCAWGQQGDDRFAISDQQATSGSKSLLLDRQSGTNDKMWGLGAAFPDVTTGWAVFALNLRVQGVKPDLGFNMEIRDKTSKVLLVVGVNNHTVTLYSKVANQRATLGDISDDGWYHITLWLPTRDGKQDQAYAMLARQDGKEHWTRVGCIGAVSAAAPANNYGIFMLNTLPGKRDYRVFLDDLQVTQQQDGPTAEDLALRWMQDCESQLPGETPAGWTKIWGDAGEDLLTVSNSAAVTGKKSVLLDRSANSPKQWGMAAQFANITEDWAVLSFCFRIQGAGNDAIFGYEIRTTGETSRVVNIGIRDRNVALQTFDWKVGEQLGQYAADTWHRLILWLPTTGGQQQRAYACLERQGADGQWSRVGALKSVAATAPVRAYGQLMLTTSPGKGNYKVYMDELQLKQQKDNPQ